MKYELEEWTNNRGKKVKRYPKLYGKHRKQEKREEVEERQAEHDKLSLKEKMAKAVPNGREYNRLEKKLKKSKDTH